MLRRKLICRNSSTGASDQIDVPKMHAPQIEYGKCDDVAVRQRSPVAPAARFKVKGRRSLCVKIGGSFNLDAMYFIGNPGAQIEVVVVNDSDLRAELLQAAGDEIFACATNAR